MQPPPSPITSSLLGPNILLNTIFSNTLSFLSSLNVSDQLLLLLLLLVIIIIIIIINVSNIPGKHEGTTENSHIGHCTHILRKVLM